MKLCIFLAAALCVAASSFAQDGQKTKGSNKKSKKLEDAYVRVINASTIAPNEPGHLGVDLYFKDRALATDMRGGEASGYRKIRFEGSDRVDVKKTGEAKLLASVPATFEAGAFYSIYVTGELSSQASALTPYIIKDKPLPAGKSRKGFAHILLFNAVSNFPVEMSVSEGRPSKLPILKETDYYLRPGSHNYKLLFPYKKTKAEMLGKLILQANSSYTVLVFPSTEKPDRPVLRLLNNSDQINDIYEQEKAVEEEAKAPKQPDESEA